MLSSNGRISFRGHMELGTGAPPVTVDDFQGIWKYDGTDTRLKARSGSAAPEAGGGLYDMLPLNPSISPDGLISFYGTLRLGTGAPVVTASTNTGLWSEIGGGSARLLLRKGDTIVPGRTFRSGFAVTTSTVNTAALNAKLSTGSALLHLDVNTPAVQLTVVAEEGQAAPGGGAWIALDGNSSDPRLQRQRRSRFHRLGTRRQRLHPRHLQPPQQHRRGHLRSRRAGPCGRHRPRHRRSHLQRL